MSALGRGPLLWQVADCNGVLDCASARRKLLRRECGRVKRLPDSRLDNERVLLEKDSMSQSGLGENGLRIAR